MKTARLPANLSRSLRYTCPAQSKIPKSFISQCLLQQKASRSFTSSPRVSTNAAPEIKFSDEYGEGLPQLHVRLVPESPSYFTGSPHFIDNLLSLQALLRKYETLPVVKPGQAPRVAWRTLVEYRNMVGEAVKASKYQKIVRVLQRLNQIHPTLMPHDIIQALDYYKRDINPQLNKAKPIMIDRFGRTLGTGRRKASTARAWIVEGNGEVLVNGKSLVEVFGRVHDRESAIWALKATERIDNYNVWALVEGGGATGQAEALTLAIAKALLAHEPLLKPALRRAGCVTRDPRRVERKKPGHLKARKMPAWVRR